jgi:hypothetical protein
MHDFKDNFDYKKSYASVKKDENQLITIKYALPVVQKD